MSGEMRTFNSPPKTKIFVGRLPEDAESKDLRKLFEQYGVVTECDVLHRYGFVHMKTEEMAARAIEELNNTKFLGVRISVEQSTGKKYRGDFSYGPLRTRGVLRDTRSVPYIRQSSGYERRPGEQLYSRALSDNSYNGGSRGSSLYGRSVLDKFKRGAYQRGCHSGDTTCGRLWTRPGTFESNSNMFRRRSPTPSFGFGSNRFGGGVTGSSGMPYHY